MLRRWNELAAPQDKGDPTRPSPASSSGDVPAAALLALRGAIEKHDALGKRVKQLSNNSSERPAFTLLASFIFPLALLL